MDFNDYIRQMREAIGSTNKPKQSRSKPSDAGREWFKENREQVEAIIGRFDLDYPDETHLAKPLK